MVNPEGYYCSREHTWNKVDGDEGLIGITHIAQCGPGEIVYVDDPDTGDAFEQDAVYGSAEAFKAVSDLYIPVSGEIIAINEKLNDHPEPVN